MRGTIIDIIPGDHARIQLANGDVQFVPWPTIERIERAPMAPAPSSIPTAPAPPSAPSASPPTRPAPAIDPADAPGARRVAAVTVHIDTTRAEVRLQGRPGDDFEWTRMCDAPCDARVPLAWEYRIVGDGLRASQAFLLDGRAGDRIVLTLDPSTNAGYVGGILVTVAGGIVIFVGAIILVTGLLVALLAVDNAGEFVAGGALVVGVGITISYFGSKLTTSNGHTGVNVTAPRTARWNEVAPRAAPALPIGAAVSVPVLTVHF